MEGGTYLEDYIMSLETLPNDVRRDFELVSIIFSHFYGSKHRFDNQNNFVTIKITSF